MFAPDRYVAALRFAAERHHGQCMVESDLPYLLHLTSVAGEVIAALPQEGVDPDLAVTCALLHDTVEDTRTTVAEIVERFGPEVAEGVQALSKDPTLARELQMADSLRRIRACPRAVWLVKLADRVTNLAPPPSKWSSAKRREYRDEAQLIADQLGEASPVLDARIRARIAGYASYL
jgi:(p)ppGpp synthase/HD superfamily hydrolase